MMLQHRDDIRGRLLHNIGIFDPWFNMFMDRLSDREQKVSANRDMVKPSAAAAAAASSHKRRISFDRDVKVFVIPSHVEFSATEKTTIWSNGAEIRLNAQRNRREFAAEGWKWEQVVEEDGMYFDKTSSEYIHPIHLGGIADLR